MVNRDYYLKRGEVGATLVATLTDENEAAMNLTGCTAQLVISLSDTVASIEDVGGAMVVDANPLLGKLSYEFTEDDADLPADTYDLEIVVTDGSGNVAKFPKQSRTVSGETVAKFGRLIVLESKTVTS